MICFGNFCRREMTRFHRWMGLGSVAKKFLPSSGICRYTCVAVHCSILLQQEVVRLETVLQVHMCCSALQCVVARESIVPRDSKEVLAVISSTLQHTAEYCNTLTLQHTATHCNTLQHTATHCNTLTLQYTATHGNRMHRMR